MKNFIVMAFVLNLAFAVSARAEKPAAGTSLNLSKFGLQFIVDPFTVRPNPNGPGAARDKNLEALDENQVKCAKQALDATIEMLSKTRNRDFLKGMGTHTVHVLFQDNYAHRVHSRDVSHGALLDDTNWLQVRAGYSQEMGKPVCEYSTARELEKIMRDWIAAHKANATGKHTYAALTNGLGAQLNPAGPSGAEKVEADANVKAQVFPAGAGGQNTTPAPAGPPSPSKSAF